MPMAQFEVQWGTYVALFKGAKKSRLIGLLTLETMVTAGVPKHDIKNNIHFIIFVTALYIIYNIPM